MMYTVVETSPFINSSSEVWSDDERTEFITWIAQNPFSGDVIPGTKGLRKVRWTRSGKGTRGGARIIYYNTLSNGKIWLLIVYTKSKFDNLPSKFLLSLRSILDE